MSFVVEIPSVFTKPTQIPVRLGNTILTGNETIQGSLSVNGSLILNSGVNHNTNVIYYDSLDISNNLNVGGDVSISGDLVIEYVSASNISAINISATSITAPDVQPTLTAGTNITISGNTISAVAATPDLTDISNTNLSSVNITATSITAPNVQPIITDGSLTIARTSGLQTSLDSKEPTITSATNLTINSLTTSSATIDANTLTMGSNKYLENKSNYAHYYSVISQNMTGTFHLVQFQGVILQNALVTRTTNSRYTINRAGYYLITSSLHPQNSGINDRVCFRGLFLKNGVENSIWSGDSFSYTRDDNFGQFDTCNLNNVIYLVANDYIEVEMTVEVGTGAFGGTMNGTQIRVRSNLTFQYIGG